MRGNGKRRAFMLVLGIVFAVLTLSVTEAGAAGPFKVRSDIAYGPNNGQRGSSRLDVYVPNERSPEPRPVVVWFHGGGWFKGNKANTTMPGKANVFIRAGFIVVSANYRLSPDLKGRRYLARNRVRFPAAHLDAARAVGWVNRHIDKFGGDPSRIVLGGESAGAQIAALLGTRPAFLKAEGVAHRQVKGVVSLDAVGFDVPRMMTPKYRRQNAGFQRMMFNAFGSPAEEKRRPRWSAASPINYADPTDPPFFFLVSTKATDRWAEAFQISVKLDQNLTLTSRAVPVSHREGVGSLLGNNVDDRGVNKPVIRFAGEVVNPVAREITISGKRVVQAKGAATATVRLDVAAKPGARQLYCQMDRHLTGLCPPTWELGVGLHSLQVEAYGFSGRLAGTKTFKIRVKK